MNRCFRVAKSATWTSLVAGAASLALTGCDALYPRAQDILISVTEISSGEPVANARVIYQLVDSPVQPDLTEDADASLFENTLQTTDSSGQASLTVPYTVMCSPLPLPPCDPSGSIMSADRVTGRAYRIRVDTDSASELFSLDITPGATVSSDTFTLAIVSISEQRSNGFIGDIRLSIE